MRTTDLERRAEVPRRITSCTTARPGQADDTDLSLVEPFPTTRASLLRKLARDAIGLTGLKYLLGRVLMDAGCSSGPSPTTWSGCHARTEPGGSYLGRFVKNAAGMLLTQRAVAGRMLGEWPRLALRRLGALAYITPFPLFLRIRSLAEHACTRRSTDMFENTRTTRAGLLARATVAPIRVNFHVEHHVLPSVPYFRLPLMHRMLRERGAVGAPTSYSSTSCAWFRPGRRADASWPALGRRPGNRRGRSRASTRALACGGEPRYTPRQCVGHEHSGTRLAWPGSRYVEHAS